ncbi:DUF1992 domain-containing protein [Granulicoccus phenolivorans]|uniref:DnaJ family domain-containing protein n=1 Tax=Granulicoccus phenolivorans TaxID=266854 RepID=UPI00040E1A15|nr:DUF1992 domain-containing protein [Granulicoccus phenolivorans]
MPDENESPENPGSGAADQPPPDPPRTLRRRYQPVVYESWIDRQIREATERGEFDNLPGAGQPLTNLDDDSPDWWIKGKLKHEGLEMPLPAGLALRKEAQEAFAKIADVTYEADAREILEDLNDRIRESYFQPLPDQGRLFVIPLVNVDPLLERWRAYRAELAEAERRRTPAPPAAAPRRRWWQRWFRR